MALNYYASIMPISSATNSSPCFQAAVACFASLAIWRIWRFTVEPLLYPEEPKTYPYWMPFIGHSFVFFRDAEDTMYRARIYFGNTRDPFKLIIMGETVYVITSASDTVSVYKNNAFSLNPWLKDLMRQFGASASSVKAMWSPVPQSKATHAEKGTITPEIPLGNIEDKPVKEVCVILFRTLLNQDCFSKDLLDVLLNTVHARMQWDCIPDWMTLGCEGDKRDVSLLKWSQHVLLEGATRSFFGASLLEIEPDLFDSFYEFDDSSWKLPYNIPDIFARDVQRSKSTAERALARYFELPKEKRADASTLVQRVEAVLVQSGIKPKDMGVLVLMFYWVINANAWKASFWMLAEIVNDPALRATVIAEIQPFISVTEPCTLGSTELADALGQRCPALVAIYHEALRIAASSTSVRIVMDDTHIRHFHLRQGGRMVIPYRQMMLDENTFGANVNKFCHERFLQNPNLHKHPNYRPFGGGSSLCPGKALAQKEILTFVALALGKFRVKASAQAREGVPEMNTKTPCIGIMAPTGNGDVRVAIEKPAW